MRMSLSSVACPPITWRGYLLSVSVALVLASGCGRRDPSVPKGELKILCGAGIRPAMEPIKAAFEEKEDCIVRVSYAGAGTLFGSLQAGVEADLYLPGDIWCIHEAEGKGFIEEHTVVAWLVPVIAVQHGNPKGIKKLADLAGGGLEIGFGKAGGCAVGKVTQDILAAAGLMGKVRVAYEALTVNRLANQIKLKALDAAIVWDAVAKQYPGQIDMVPIEGGNCHAVALAMGLLSQSKNKALARQFVEFAAGDFGAKCFRENHYQVPGKKP